MRITLIYNSGAGEGKTDMSTLRARIEAAGHTVSCYSSKGKNWTSALVRPADLVAVAGGDGTIGRVAKQLIGRNLPIAVLPLGTANNISRTLGATELPLDEWIASWSTARRIPFDTGTASGPWGSTPFIEGIGAGLFAWTTPRPRASPTLAAIDPDQKIVYALQRLIDRLEQCPATRINAELDGKTISGEYLMLEALNTQYVGPNLFLAPEGSACDGQMDVALVRESERAELRAHLAGWQRGLLCRPDLPTHSGRHLRIEWTGFKLHIDDQFWPKDGETFAPIPATIDIRIEPGALEFLAPPASAGN